MLARRLLSAPATSRVSLTVSPKIRFHVKSVNTSTVNAVIIKRDIQYYASVVVVVHV